MKTFLPYIEQKALFTERGLIALVRLISVAIPENADECTDFELVILKIIACQNSAYKDGDELGVGSVDLDHYDGIITARGYVSWSLIFNDNLKKQIMHQIDNEGVSPGRAVRSVLREAAIASLAADA